MSSIVEFYRGEARDYLGRRVAEIWEWDNDTLESAHDYIQVLFPNERPSGVAPGAPRLDAETVAAFRDDPRLRDALAKSLDLMLRFYGLEYDDHSGTVVERPDFEQRAKNWLKPYNHNFLRITRILNCLVALGLADRARAFFDRLDMLYGDRADVIGPRTFNFWKDAVSEH